MVYIYLYTSRAPVINCIIDPVDVTTDRIRGSVAPTDCIPPGDKFILTSVRTSSIEAPIPINPSRNPPKNAAIKTFSICKGLNWSMHA